MTTEIPKHELLGKLLRMSTSPNDGEALTAIRKANELLKSAGWDWDKLLAGKIKVAADPFSGLGTPSNPAPVQHAPAPPTPRQAPPRPAPQAPPRPQPQAAPKPQAPPKPFEPWSHRSTNGQTNIYPGNCYCCGYSVSAKAGHLFVPSQFNQQAVAGKKIICNKCDGERFTFVDRRPAPQARPTTTAWRDTPRASDL